MNFPFVLNYLQNLYPGQLVLYVDDMAKVLGASDMHMSSLIAGKKLPFKVKNLGGLLCVDIFQVAQWMSSDEDLPMGSGGARAMASPSKLKSSPVKSAKVLAPIAAVEAPALTGNVAAKLLKMRHQQATDMARFVHELDGREDMAFMNEVMEKVFYSADLLTSSYVVTVKKLSPKGVKLLAQETRKYFETEDDACDYLSGQLKSWVRRSGSPRNKRVEHFVLEESGRTIVHAIASPWNLALVCSTNGYTLPDFPLF